GPARPRRLLDPRRTGAKVVSAVDHGAEQIGVLHDDPTRPRDVFILEGDLAAGDRAVVGVFDRRALSFGEAAHEFRYALGAVARGQLHGERRLAGRLRAGENDPNHAASGAGASAEAARDRRHARWPSTARTR